MEANGFPFDLNLHKYLHVLLILGLSTQSRWIGYRLNGAGNSERNAKSRATLLAPLTCIATRSSATRSAAASHADHAMNAVHRVQTPLELLVAAAATKVPVPRPASADPFRKLFLAQSFTSVRETKLHEEGEVLEGSEAGPKSAASERTEELASEATVCEYFEGDEYRCNYWQGDDAEEETYASSDAEWAQLEDGYATDDEAGLETSNAAEFHFEASSFFEFNSVTSTRKRKFQEVEEEEEEEDDEEWEEHLDLFFGFRRVRRRVISIKLPALDSLEMGIEAQDDASDAAGGDLGGKEEAAETR